MQYEPKPRLSLFVNKMAGQPIKRKDGTLVTNTKGNSITHGSFNGKINLPEGLPAGEYEVSVYNTIAKSGLEYLSGTIKKAWVKPTDQNTQDKQNDCQSQSEKDEIPF